MRESAERAAWITALGVVVAALIGAVATICARQPADLPVQDAPAESRPSLTLTTTEPPAMSTTDADKSAAGQAAYNISVWVSEGKSYIDPETGFVYAIDEIDNQKWLHADGALSRYTTPDGKAHERFRYPVGYRVNFQYRGRHFFFAIEEVDYPAKSAKIRIRQF